ncbi:TVP38/TMEM64 family protein [Citrobacter amalonaticus]|uniref:TVP38/TMEM64 family membrane protein n=1 Tax=Citrobacter amalonaticus TaxID=35703 RepID=A0A2S4RYY2_CITAM|nr:VTT domain-containing protein [Citrobacter amalonaticus]POT57618.1 TVP38/TMEM64 family protein [Citrobacter amalonaticus]POT76855.1 TVP38/TMEM64 family protein [Citrobacter amalonaticus]POU65934.1 TVP38/TMEM64 family protein [Citrobacter amalonaticus]POV06091.1 TVP38/TMEM64 family protein [Citrobacter amalonaticus]
MNAKKILLSVLLILFVAGVVWAMPPGFLALETLRRYHATMAQWQQHSPVVSAVVYFCVYTLVASLSIPGAALLTLLGGALFGLWQGILLVSFASTFGATLAMLASRYLLRDWVSRRFARQMATVDRGMARDGAFYLFALRLMPLFPFVIVNLLAGLTSVSTRRYWWVSQAGMFPATVIYLNAGRQLSQLTSMRDIISPAMLAAFALLGLLPLASRWWFKRFFRE